MQYSYFMQYYYLTKIIILLHNFNSWPITPIIIIISLRGNGPGTDGPLVLSDGLDESQYVHALNIPLLDGLQVRDNCSRFIIELKASERE